MLLFWAGLSPQWAGGSSVEDPTPSSSLSPGRLTWGPPRGCCSTDAEMTRKVLGMWFGDYVPLWSDFHFRLG